MPSVATFLEGMTTGLSVFALAIWCLLWIIHMCSIFIAKWKLHKQPVVPPTDEPFPGISIVKPLVGVDSNLSSNLETYFLLQYPGQYELLFCICDAADSAVTLVKSLMSKYSHVNARIFIGGPPIGVNPKISNMAQALTSARYDLIYIADSGLRAKPDTLQDLLIAMRPDVGMVHQLPYVIDRDPPDFANIYHKIFFGTSHAKMYLFLNWIGINCTTGMSSMIRRSIIEQAGGPSYFASFLAEDYFLAKAAFQQGWRVALTSNVAIQASGNASVRALQNRIMRWVKLRNAMIPLIIIAEPATECFASAGIVSLAASYLFGWSPVIFIPIHCVSWVFLDYILLSLVNPTKLKFAIRDYLICWIYKEVLALPLFVQATFNPVISWHGSSYYIRWGGLVEKLETRPFDHQPITLASSPSFCSGGLNVLQLTQYGFR